MTNMTTPNDREAAEVLAEHQRQWSEVHAERCHANQPGDRQCNCHISYGFATAEDMEEADATDAAIAQAFREAARRGATSCTWGQARNAINARARTLSPPPLADSSVAGLVGKWRAKSAEEVDGIDRFLHCEQYTAEGRSNAYDTCADELEAALRSATPAPVSAGRGDGVVRVPVDDPCRRELENIVNARRFDRGAFRDDTEFADWALSRARHCLAAAPAKGNDDG